MANTLLLHYVNVKIPHHDNTAFSGDIILAREN